MAGKPNKAIANRLEIGLRTVEARRQSIFKTMGVSTVAELVQVVTKALAK